MMRTFALGLLAASLMATCGNDAHAWVNVRFGAGINFQWESSGIFSHGHGCRNCGGSSFSFGGPMSYGEGFPVQGNSIGDSTFQPATISFGQGPVGYTPFQPASYAPYSYSPGSYSTPTGYYGYGGAFGR